MKHAPSELKEQSGFVQWCREMGFKICATAQSTYTTSWRAINQNVAAGVVRGFPDLAIIIPSKYRSNKKPILIFIEMKRQRGGVISKEQHEWIVELNNCAGVHASVCRGKKEAINYVMGFLEEEPPIDNSFINSLK